MKLRPVNVGRTSFPLALFLLAGLAAPGQSGFEISGSVKDITGAFVSNARVRLFSDDRVREARANDYGNFEFGSVPPGIYDIEAASDGFQAITREGVRVVDKNLTQLSFALRPGEGNGRCVITISGSAAKAEGLFYDQRVDETNLIGMALDPSGVPLSAALLSLSSSERTWTATSKRQRGCPIRWSTTREIQHEPVTRRLLGRVTAHTNHA